MQPACQFSVLHNCDDARGQHSEILLTGDLVYIGESYGIHRGRSMEDAFDVLGHLVPEVSIKILRMLDMKSLGSASKVCKHWRSLCYRDTTLKRRMKRFRELQVLKKKLRRVRKKLAYIKKEIAELGNNHSLKLVFMES
ncbi:uncharacterized protein LOC124621231 [Schistocerca americana]|uniref:uncharacterized protein LOC124621231 n=1 Tax=Schistocerca americana TaxID=7009 RepID=UPI001F502376|nr:uncharacterized protein LOC124621231 [Schistocerca americana]